MVEAINGPFNMRNQTLRECFDCYNTWYIGGKDRIIQETTPVATCPRCRSSDVKTYDSILPAKVAGEGSVGQ